VFRSPPGLVLRSIEFESNSIESWHSIDIESTEDMFDSSRIYGTRIVARSIRYESAGDVFDSSRIYRTRIVARSIRYESVGDASDSIRIYGVTFDSNAKAWRSIR
jgi:hypothetical protein